MKRVMILSCLLLLVVSGSGVLAQNGAWTEPSLADLARRTRAELARRKECKLYTNDNLPPDDGRVAFGGTDSGDVFPVGTLALVSIAGEFLDQFFPSISSVLAAAPEISMPAVRPVTAPVSVLMPGAATPPAAPHLTPSDPAGSGGELFGAPGSRAAVAVAALPLGNPRQELREQFLHHSSVPAAALPLGTHRKELHSLVAYLNSAAPLVVAQRTPEPVVRAAAPANPVLASEHTAPTEVAPVQARRRRLESSRDGAVLIAALGSGAVVPTASSTRASAGQEFRDQLLSLGSARVTTVQNAPAAVAQAAARAVPPAVPAPLAPPAPPAAAPRPTVNIPSQPQRVSYVGGKLRIDALDMTLSEVLAKVSAAISVKIDIPPSASSERLPVVKLGPGPAREVLAALLGGTDFDYLILAPAADPDGIQDVMLMPREKKGSAGNDTNPAARPTRAPFGRTPLSPPETPEESQAPVAAQPETTEQPPNSAPSAPPEAPTPAEQPALSPAALINRSGLTTEGAMNPPATMDPQSINQMLQQMYQQRMQMNPQQGRQGVTTPPPVNPGNQQ